MDLKFSNRLNSKFYTNFPIGFSLLKLITMKLVHTEFSLITFDQALTAIWNWYHTSVLLTRCDTARISIHHWYIRINIWYMQQDSVDGYTGIVMQPWKWQHSWNDTTQLTFVIKQFRERAWCELISI